MSKYSLLTAPENFFEKSHNAEKKVKGGPLGFFNIHSVAKLQKIEGRPFGEIFPEKSRTMPKN